MLPTTWDARAFFPFLFIYLLLFLLLLFLFNSFLAKCRVDVSGVLSTSTQLPGAIARRKRKDEQPEEKGRS